MPEYSIQFTKRARKQLDKLDDTIANPILETIESLSLNPRPYGYEKLKTRDGYRIRSGDYVSYMK